ncbi:MAG: hypothetical protein Kow0029_22650 [Candidatus Rifleibacteriota bacterium]
MKKKVKPDFSDYLSEAFNAGLVIKGMGEIPVNKLFILGTFILGFGNPGFWFGGIALEIIYLYFLSTNPRFQKYVESKQYESIQKDRNLKLQEIVASLDSELQQRLNKLNSNLAEINKLMNWNLDETAGFLNQSKQETLNHLPTIFLKLLKTKQLIQQSLARTKPDEIHNEIKKLESQLKAPNISPALERSLQGNIEIQKRRLENLANAKENEMLVEMELQRIESQLALVREEIALDSSPEGLSSNIDRINATLGETQNWLETHSDFLRKLSGPPLHDYEFDSVDPANFASPPPQRELE